MNVTQYRLAKGIAVDAGRVHATVNEEWAISAGIELPFSRFLGNSVAFWMGLLSQCDLETTGKRLAERLSRVVAHSAAWSGS